MAYNFNQFKEEVKKTEEWFKSELSNIRAGRANPAILDSIKVEAYGVDMPLNQVAGISVEDVRTIRIAPWDMSQAKPIEKAIMLADIGLSLSVDDKGVRVIFPDLTSERREMLVKLAKQKLEEARIALRGEREKTIKDLDKKEKDGEISEDEKFRLKTDLQKMVDDSGVILEQMFMKKEKEISE